MSMMNFQYSYGGYIYPYTYIPYPYYVYIPISIPIPSLPYSAPIEKRVTNHEERLSALEKEKKERVGKK